MNIGLCILTNKNTGFIMYNYDYLKDYNHIIFYALTLDGELDQLRYSDDVLKNLELEIIEL